MLRIESVGWCNTVSTNSTGPILIGSNRGLIMESCIDTGDDTKFFAGSVDQYFKQLYNFNQGDTRNLAVTSLEYFSTCSTNSGSRECCVLASTSSRLYQFSGVVNFSTDEVPVFQNFFSLYHASPPRHIDLQPDEEGDRKLRLFYNTDRRPLHHAVAPTQFGWMTPQGVYFGSVKPSSGVDQATALAQRTVIGNAYLMPYPEIKVTNKNRFEESNNDVIDMVMTEFHILLLYPDRLRVICSLNQQLIFEDIYTSRYGQLIGLFKDPVDGQIWAYTERAVFKYKIVRESRDVWEIYLKMKKFEMAESNCHEDPVKLDKVYSCQAEHAFEKGQYQESALYYAITRTSFEEVALKFINKSKEGALRAYLQKKLSNLQRDDVTQLTMLSTWLVELYLNQLGQLRDDENLSDQYGKCTEDLRKLFKQDYLRQVFQENRSTIYDLLISHGDIDNYVFFSILMQDYERVVNHHIQNNNYLDALEALKRQNSISLYYKFSPTLMQNIPKQVVEAWIGLGRKIDPLQLIPSLIKRTQKGRHDPWREAIRYLQYSTRELSCTDPAIHNYLLSLYVKYQPSELLSYLKEQGEEKKEVCYDVKYALRLCLVDDDDGGDDDKTKQILNRACVFIYTVMGLYEEAVAMALKVDVELAKSITDRGELEEDDEVKKKLWLKIARHVVEEEKDIKKAMLFLQESKDLLKIEDVLPFFPDFVTIDHFKDALCESLSEYNKGIDQLKEEMNVATSSAKSIRWSIQQSKNRHLVVGGTERCCICMRPLLTRAFYMFPCQHGFHHDCLLNEIRPLLIDAKRELVDRLHKELVALSQPLTDEAANRDRKLKRQQLVHALDETIADECILCGEVAVRSIDMPFVDTHDGWL